MTLIDMPASRRGLVHSGSDYIAATEHPPRRPINERRFAVRCATEGEDGWSETTVRLDHRGLLDLHAVIVALLDGATLDEIPASQVREGDILGTDEHPHQCSESKVLDVSAGSFGAVELHMEDARGERWTSVRRPDQTVSVRVPRSVS